MLLSAWIGGACTGEPATPSSPDAVATTAPGSSVPTSPPSSASVTASLTGGPAAAEADGWTLVITAPQAGTRVGPETTVCYQVTGETREADVALDVRVTAPGSSAPLASVRPAVAVGRGDVVVDLSGVPPGTYDLSIGLVVDGELPPDRVVLVPAVSRVKVAPDVICGQG